MENKLKRRIIEVSYNLGLSHLGSCLTALPIILEIYQKKKKDEKFILSAGHAHVAHAVVMEEYKIIKNAEENVKRYGIHCEREGGCAVSTGSLGMGISIACGMALADRKKNVHCLISDGECAEGVVYEIANIIRREKLTNLKVHLNLNHWGAYRQIFDDDTDPICFMLQDYIKVYLTDPSYIPFLKGQDAHYYKMTEKDYKVAMKILI